MLPTVVDAENYCQSRRFSAWSDEVPEMMARSYLGALQKEVTSADSEEGVSDVLLQVPMLAPGTAEQISLTKSFTPLFRFNNCEAAAISLSDRSDKIRRLIHANSVNRAVRQGLMFYSTEHQHLAMVDKSLLTQSAYQAIATASSASDLLGLAQELRGRVRKFMKAKTSTVGGETLDSEIQGGLAGISAVAELESVLAGHEVPKMLEYLTELKEGEYSGTKEIAAALFKRREENAVVLQSLNEVKRMKHLPMKARLPYLLQRVNESQKKKDVYGRKAYFSQERVDAVKEAYDFLGAEWMDDANPDHQSFFEALSHVFLSEDFIQDTRSALEAAGIEDTCPEIISEAARRLCRRRGFAYALVLRSLAIGTLKKVTAPNTSGDFFLFPVLGSHCQALITTNTTSNIYNKAPSGVLIFPTDQGYSMNAEGRNFWLNGLFWAQSFHTALALF